ncbi:hypothetical protein PPYR_13415 [Photinus pyralis]|uniref:DUF4485 domain-containing protein n=1 Tax=Photinus pyralis TaxID=7054 RepID=A0A5N4A8Z6_PHOPY|nr:hypothetical protein PPYR_13415 [Photinus pyralis]
MDTEGSRELDAEFQRILHIIKPYIPRVKNIPYFTSYVSWLQKLRMVDSQDKEERNKYVAALCQQIQAGVLEFPFTEFPDDGPLAPFKISDARAQQGPTDLKHYQQNIHFKEMLNAEQADIRVAHKKRTPYTISQNLPIGFPTVMKCVNLSNGLETTTINPMLKNSNKKDDDDESWCDISDGTSTTITLEELHITPPVTPGNNVQEVYENKITELMKIINDLQKQNLKLGAVVAGYERDINIRNTTAERSIHNLVEEINSLRSKLQEQSDVKAVLKSSQSLADNHWKGIVTSLTSDVKESQQQNEILREEMNELEKRLEESMTNKQRLLIAHEKEIEDLKQSHKKEKTELEHQFYEKVSKLITDHDCKIEDVKTNYERNVQDKDREIGRLEDLIQVQCKRMHEEVSKIRTQIEENQIENPNDSLEKITVLQKCIAKMDRLFKKTERSFNRQITKLKTEIEMRDKIIQLSTQKAKIVANTKMERQAEIDATILQLEERYKHLLESQKSYFLSEKKQDATLISGLRAIMAQNNIESDI